MDTPKFKKGDRVRCVNSGIGLTLVEGKEYTVKRLEEYYGQTYVSVEGKDGEYFTHRFELVEPKKEQEEKPMKEEKQQQLELSVEEKARRYDEIKKLATTKGLSDLAFARKVCSVTLRKPWPADEFQVGDTVYFDGFYSDGSFSTTDCYKDPQKVVIRGVLVAVRPTEVEVRYTFNTFSDHCLSTHQMSEEYAKQVNLRKVP